MRRRSWIATRPDLEPTTLVRRSVDGPAEIWAFFRDDASREGDRAPGHEVP